MRPLASNQMSNSIWHKVKHVGGMLAGEGKVITSSRSAVACAGSRSALLTASTNLTSLLSALTADTPSLTCTHTVNIPVTLGRAYRALVNSSANVLLLLFSCGEA